MICIISNYCRKYFASKTDCLCYESNKYEIMHSKRKLCKDKQDLGLERERGMNVEARD